MSIDKGYIKVYRTFFDTPEWKKERVFSTAEAWLWLLANAHWGVDDRIVKVGGKEVRVKRGQLLLTYRNLCKTFGWSLGAVSRWLEQSLEQSRIKFGTKFGTKCTIVTICNYDKYNPVGEEVGTNSGTNFAEKWNKLWNIKKEYIRYIEEEHKEETHTSLINLIRGVWGEKETPFTLIANGKTHQVGVEFFCSYCAAMVDWMAEYTPSVATLKEQLSIVEFQRMVSAYDLYDISRIMVDMQNSKTIGKRTSVYATFVSFANRDFVLAERKARIAQRDHYRSPRTVCKEYGVVSIIDYRNKHYNNQTQRSNGEKH